MTPQNKNRIVIKDADLSGYKDLSNPIQSKDIKADKIPVGPDGYTDLSEPTNPIGQANKEHSEIVIEPISPGLSQRLKDRFYDIGQSLVDKNTGKANFSANFRHNVGQEILALKDENYRAKVGMMFGSMALGSAGMELFMQEGLLPKIVGGASVTIGMYGSTKAPVDVVHGFNDLESQGLLAPTPQQVDFNR